MSYRATLEAELAKVKGASAGGWAREATVCPIPMTAERIHDRVNLDRFDLINYSNE